MTWVVFCCVELACVRRGIEMWIVKGCHVYLVKRGVLNTRSSQSFSMVYKDENRTTFHKCIWELPPALLMLNDKSSINDKKKKKTRKVLMREIPLQNKMDRLSASFWLLVNFELKREAELRGCVACGCVVFKGLEGVNTCVHSQYLSLTYTAQSFLLRRSKCKWEGPIT